MPPCNDPLGPRPPSGVREYRHAVQVGEAHPAIVELAGQSGETTDERIFHRQGRERDGHAGRRVAPALSAANSLVLEAPTSGSAFANGQYSRGRTTLGGSASGSMTAHYLNPAVPQNYSNAATSGDFSSRYQRVLGASDRLDLTVRHDLSRYDIPNEQVQESAGERQTADTIETMGIASFEHAFSSHAMADLRGMARDNANDFHSDPQSTPIGIFQHDRFREVYFKATVTADRGPNEVKVGVESDSKFLQENLNYEITDASQFDDGTARTFGFAAQCPDLDQGPLWRI